MVKNYHIHNGTLNRFPVVIDLPHSGTRITNEMTKALLPNAILANTDWFLKELYHFLPEMGFTVIENNLNRYLIDPNRDPNEDLTGDYYHLVYAKNTFGHPLYKRPLTSTEINNRLMSFYQPYHDQLQQLLENKRNVFGSALLIDLHSFAEYTHPSLNPTADIVLGNDFNRTTSKKTFNYFQRLFTQRQYSVANNFPFRGGYITRHYGSQKGIFSIQIELRYKKYIGDRYFDEEILTHWDPIIFNHAQLQLQQVFKTLASDLDNGQLFFN